MLAEMRDSCMDLKHRVTISVSKKPVIESGRHSIRSRLLDRILGKRVGLFVVTPGDSVRTVEIKEIKEGGTDDEKNQIDS